MKTPDDRSRPDDRLPPSRDIESEPTRVPVSDAGSFEESIASLASEAEPTASLVSDPTLLRSRLRAIALAAAIVTGIRFLFGLFTADWGDGRGGMSYATISLFSLAVFALLFSRQTLSDRQLRRLEYLLFGLFALGILVSQYRIGSDLIGRGDAIGVVEAAKNGVLSMIVLMIVYGMLIPNDPKTTARVVLTMAVGPIVVLTMLFERQANAGIVINPAAAREIVVSNAVFLILGAVLAIVAAYLSNGLSSELNDARRLGHYQIGEKLGAGLGEVYLAEHQLLKRPCALRLIKPDLQSDPSALARVEWEIQTAALLSHPNTIHIYDYGQTDEGTFYYAMEYLAGLNTADLVGQFGPLPPGRAVYIARQACQALAETHRLGLVHRDLGPANIFVAILGGECDVVKVLDIGLVDVSADPDPAAFTAESLVGGAPSCLSPEQAAGVRPIDGRSDIYALGAILQFLLSGKPPLEKKSPAALLGVPLSDAVRPAFVSGTEVPGDLKAVMLRCLAKAPSDRYPDAHALAAALGACRCAAEWDVFRAEQWWLEQASKQLPQQALGARRKNDPDVVTVAVD